MVLERMGHETKGHTNKNIEESDLVGKAGGDVEPVRVDGHALDLLPNHKKIKYISSRISVLCYLFFNNFFIT